MTAFVPQRTLLFVHGATYPAHTAFDVPLGGLSWMDYIAGRGFDVWCMDIRGYGRSTRPPEMAQPPEANAPIVRGDTAVADISARGGLHPPAPQPPRIIHMGWSWGSTLMGRFAADNPARSSAWCWSRRPGCATGRAPRRPARRRRSAPIAP